MPQLHKLLYYAAVGGKLDNYKDFPTTFTVSSVLRA